MADQSKTVSDELLRSFMTARIGSASPSPETATAKSTAAATAKSTTPALEILKSLTLHCPSLSILKLLVKPLHVAALHLGS
jgi:hypothetical protein